MLFKFEVEVIGGTFFCRLGRMEAWFGYRPPGSNPSFYAFRQPVGCGYEVQWRNRELVLSLAPKEAKRAA